MQNVIKKEDVIHALQSVIDPEMHIDVYTLGLIYDVTVTGEHIHILMTLTTPLCPYADEILNAVRAACAQFGIPVTVDLTFTPPWVAPTHLRAILGI